MIKIQSQHETVGQFSWLSNKTVNFMVVLKEKSGHYQNQCDLALRENLSFLSDASQKSMDLKTDLAISQPDEMHSNREKLQILEAGLSFSPPDKDLTTPLIWGNRQ